MAEGIQDQLSKWKLHKTSDGRTIYRRIKIVLGQRFLLAIAERRDGSWVLASKHQTSKPYTLENCLRRAKNWGNASARWEDEING